MLAGNNIRVFVRVRPLNQAENQVENAGKCTDCIAQDSIKVTNLEGTGFNPHIQFSFDKVFDQASQQERVFRTVAGDIIDSAFQGINGAIFCYGQTASGKTYTCVGPKIKGQERGLLPRIIESVMEKVKMRPSNIDLRAKVSLVEIYNEKVTDLLDLTHRNLKLRQNKSKGVFIEHVTERYISKAEEGYQLLSQGLENRSVGCTQMNGVSSRSHMLFMITIIQNNFSTGEARSAKLTVIDLAGSEKISKTGTEGKMLNEAIKINTSLSALGNVIHALSESKGHIPYRDSKLTRLLQESLGGNSLTSLIVNVSPSSYNETETITSLRFGQRAKGIKNCPKINKEYTVEQLMLLLEKAQVKIKSQAKIIEELTKKKRVGGYGMIQNKPLTLHIINYDDDIDSNLDSLSQADDPLQSKSQKQAKDSSIDAEDKKKSLRKPTLKSQKSSNNGNLKILATSLKCIKLQNATPRFKVKIMDKNSMGSNEDLGEQVQSKGITRTRSQAGLMASMRESLQEENNRLKTCIESVERQNKEFKGQLQGILMELDKLKKEVKAKESIIGKKTAVIDKLKHKNHERKAEIQKQINNLKSFWQRFYSGQDPAQVRTQQPPNDSGSVLKQFNSAITLKVTRSNSKVATVSNCQQNS